MGNKVKQYRECDECGEPIESGTPTTRLCKRCAARDLNKRTRDGSRHRPQDPRTKKKNKPGEDDYYEEEFNYR